MVGVVVSKRLLAIDTSTDKASVALSFNQSIDSVVLSGVRQHAQQLLPMIQQLLANAQLTLAELDGIVLGIGPGSFTGLRIACSVAKALAYAHALPVYGVCSLDVIAHQLRLEHSVSLGVMAMMDARMQEIYWAYYPPESLFAEASVQVTSAAQLTVPAQGSFVLAGWGFDNHSSFWSAAFNAAIQATYAVAPNAAIMIPWVDLANISAMSAADISPLYVRNNVAQVRGKHG